MTFSMATPPNRWLLIVGGRAGASSGVPLPYHRTRWAPSIADLVTHHIFRTQSRELFKGLDAALAAKKPMLGFIANSLDAQAAFLAQYLEGLTPHTPVLRLADLAKAGMFEAIVTNAPDRLLDRALERVGVPFHEVTADKPSAPAAKKGVTSLPVFREWDDHVFLDTDERRARESQFVRSRLDELIKSVDAVLVVGMSPDASELTRALIGAITGRPQLRVVWVDEALVDVEPRPVIEQLGALHPSTEWERVTDLGAFLDHVAAERSVPLTPLIEPAPPKKPAIARVMSQSFDVRWMLELVPGMVLFWFAIKRIPKISVKMIISLFAFVICLVAFANWRMTVNYREMVAPVQARLAAAQAQLASADHHLGAVRARTELEAALASLDKMRVPSSMFAVGPFRSRLNSHFAALGSKARTMRDHTLTPLEYRNGLEDRFAADPSLVSMGTHPPLRVHELAGPARAAEATDEDPRGIEVDEYDQGRGVAYASFRTPQALAPYLRRERVVLYAPSPPLVHVTLRQAMLDEAKDGGRLPLEVDFTHLDDSALIDQLLVQAGVVAGFVGDRAPMFAQGAVLELLEAGRATFYVTHLEVGGVTRNLARVRDLVARFPQARAVIGVSTVDARGAAAAAIPDFTFLSVAELEWADALGFLRQRTPPAYAQQVMENSYLRRGLVDPVILSLLVDYARHAAVAPRSLGVLYDRLLVTLLLPGDRGVAAKREALGAIAAEHYRTGGRLTRQRATQLIGGDLDAGSRLLDELVAGGVLRYRADTWVDFESPGLRAACVAAHLSTLPWDERETFLLAQPDEVIAYHAGILPNADQLVRDLLEDYEVVQARLDDDGQKYSLVNPYAPVLHKVALAVQNGQVSEKVARRVEQLVFAMLDHQNTDIQRQGAVALGEMSSPGIRWFLIAMLDQSMPNDTRMLTTIAQQPDTVFLGAVERWLARVGTDRDARKAERVSQFGEGMSDETLNGVGAALSALSQLGTDEALGVAMVFAAPTPDPRFTPADWARIRRGLLRDLLRDHHVEHARSLIAEVAKDPASWSSAVVQLSRAGDDATAKVLLGILARTADGEAKLKDKAAIALSLMPPDVVDPLLQPVLDADDDASAYAALVLGYRGHGADLAKVETLARATKGKTPKDVDARYPRTLRAVALFSSPEAFAIFRELYLAAPPIVRESDLAESLQFFRTDDASKFALERMVCAPVKADSDEVWMLRGLSAHRTAVAHDGVATIVRMVEGGVPEPALRGLCGQDITAALAHLEQWRQASPARFLDVLGSFHDPADIPLLAAWAQSFDPDMRKAALASLAGFRDGATARALETSLRSFPTDKHAIAAMEQQGRPENEPVLLAQLETTSYRVEVVLALARCGGEDALLKLYELRRRDDDRTVQEAADWAIPRIATRLLGRTLPRDVLIEAMTH